MRQKRKKKDRTHIFPGHREDIRTITSILVLAIQFFILLHIFGAL